MRGPRISIGRLMIANGAVALACALLRGPTPFLHHRTIELVLCGILPLGAILIAVALAPPEVRSGRDAARSPRRDFLAAGGAVLVLSLVGVRLAPIAIHEAVLRLIHRTLPALRPGLAKASVAAALFTAPQLALALIVARLVPHPLPRPSGTGPAPEVPRCASSEST